jgi:hypothetical protein
MPMPTPTTDYPDDINKGSWYEKAVKKMIDEGIMVSVGDNKWGTGLETTRGMVATILYRLENSPGIKANMAFDDLESGKYYYDAVIWGAEKSLLFGDKGTAHFRPEDVVTRQEIAAILKRYADFKNIILDPVATPIEFNDMETAWAKEEISLMQQAGVIIGYPDGTFRPHNPVKREELAVMLYRFLFEE